MLDFKSDNFKVFFAVEVIPMEDSESFPGCAFSAFKFEDIERETKDDREIPSEIVVLSDPSTSFFRAIYLICWLSSLTSFLLASECGGTTP